VFVINRNVLTSIILGIIGVILLGVYNIAEGYAKTLAIFGIITFIFFLIQFFLCFKLKRTAIKLIPAYIFLLLFFFSILMFIGVFGTGFLSAEKIVATLLIAGSSFGFLGFGIAWMVYWIYKKMNIK
jgi:hypothetical protein